MIKGWTVVLDNDQSVAKEKIGNHILHLRRMSKEKLRSSNSRNTQIAVDMELRSKIFKSIPFFFFLT
jgi:hypothetical protein